MGARCCAKWPPWTVSKAGLLCPDGDPLVAAEVRDDCRRRPGARHDGNTARDDDVDMARDRALIARAQAGDRAAFDELYLHYFRRLYRLCLRRLSDPHEAEDVAQDAFVRAWRALPRFCGERRFYPWLSVIAANRCTDVLRKRSRSTPVAEFFGSDPDSGDEVDDRVLHEVDAAMVGEALTRLTERHRRILSLREDAGMTYQAIAEHEGVAVSAVETLLWRARQALKREFCALAEAAEGRGAALVGLGIVGRLLSHVLRLPVRTAKRLAHFTPASAVLTVASISAVGAVAIGVTHAAARRRHPAQGREPRSRHDALGGVPGVSGVGPGWPVATGGAPGVAGASDATDAGAGDGSGTGATFLGGSSVMPGVTGLDGSGPGSSLYPAGAGGGGAAVADGTSGSGAGLGGLLDRARLGRHVRQWFRRRDAGRHPGRIGGRRLRGLDALFRDRDSVGRRRHGGLDSFFCDGRGVECGGQRKRRHHRRVGRRRARSAPRSPSWPRRRRGRSTR